MRQNAHWRRCKLLSIKRIIYTSYGEQYGTDFGPTYCFVPAATALHPAVYVMLVTCTLWVVAAALIFFAGNIYAKLQLAVATFFAAMFLSTPLCLLRLSRHARPTSGDFREWASGEFEAADSTIDARHAAAMVLIAPVAVAVGLTAIGFVAWLAATGAI